ncbi:MAG TPA: hypothetical protein VKR83_07815 [Ktedonobacteraceae bacterium]|nr:hypothetical protein [Ktedonobacteraceae bacterium]
MPSHPSASTLTTPLWQQIDHLVSAQIYENRAELAAPLERKVVNSQNRDGDVRDLWQAQNMPENGHPRRSNPQAQGEPGS